MLIPVIFGELGYAISALLYPVPRSRMGSTLILSKPKLPLEVWREDVGWLVLDSEAITKLERQKPELAYQLRTDASKRRECLKGSRVLKIEHRKQKDGSQHEYILAYVDVKYEGERVFRLQRMGKASLASGNAADMASQSSKKLSSKLVGGTEEAGSEDGSAAIDQIVLDEKPGFFSQDTLLCTLRFNGPGLQPTFVDLCAVCCAVASVYSDYHLVKSQCYLFAVSVYLVLGAAFPSAPSEQAKEIKTRGIWRLFPTASRSWTKYERWTAVTSDLEGVPLPGEEGIPMPSTDARPVQPDVRSAHRDNAELRPLDREASLTPKGRAKLARLREVYTEEALSLGRSMDATVHSQPVFDRTYAMAPPSALRADRPPGAHDDYAPPPPNARASYPRAEDASTLSNTFEGQSSHSGRPTQRSSTWSQQAPDVSQYTSSAMPSTSTASRNDAGPFGLGSSWNRLSFAPLAPTSSAYSPDPMSYRRPRRDHAY